jgi:hypothetical protein
MAAARMRLEALADVQPVAPIEGGCMADECVPVVSPEASAQDAVFMHEQVEAPPCAAMDTLASADERPHVQKTGTETGAEPASEKRVQALQTPGKAGEIGALGRFDRWFFGDLASQWRARA